MPPALRPCRVGGTWQTQPGGMVTVSMYLYPHRQVRVFPSQEGVRARVASSIQQIVLGSRCAWDIVVKAVCASSRPVNQAKDAGLPALSCPSKPLVQVPRSPLGKVVPALRYF
jgi:hypothetical protein